MIISDLQYIESINDLDVTGAGRGGGRRHSRHYRNDADGFAYAEAGGRNTKTFIDVETRTIGGAYSSSYGNASSRSRR